MSLMQGKKGVIFGVSNKRGIAYAIAQAIHDQGGEMVFTYANDSMRDRVVPIAEEMKSKLVLPCDVTREEEIAKVFEEAGRIYGSLDFVVHAVAFANREDLNGDFSKITREGWNLALGVSAYSLLAVARHARPLMHEGSSILTLTYMGSVQAVPHYNVMGVAKAALEASVRYLAAEFGPAGIRVNALSAGPVKTLAAKGISNLELMLKVNRNRAPLKRNVLIEEVGKSGLYLVSDLSSGVTGEVHYVDCGFNVVAMAREEVIALVEGQAAGAAAVE